MGIGCKSHFTFLSMDLKLHSFVMIIGLILTPLIAYGEHFNETSSLTLMMHEYKDFYQAFQTQKLEDENNILTKYKNEEKLAKEKKQKSFLYLGLIETQLNNNDIEAAYSTLKNMPATLRYFSPEQKLIYNLLRAKLYYARKDYARTVLLLKKIAYEKPGVYFNIVSVLYIQSLVNLDLKFEAIDYFQKESKLLESILNWDDYNSLLVKIASFLIDYEQYTKALEYLKRPLLYYPLYDSGYKAMQLLAKIECSGRSVGELFHVSKNSTLLEDQIFNRTAFNEDAKNFVLSMAGIDPINIIPAKNIDELTILEKEHLLQKLKTLISARQYLLAKKLADYLSNSKIYRDNFQEDEVLFYKARVYNSLNESRSASNFYKELLDKYPLSNLVKMAKLRYAFSLKFSGEYEKSSEFIKQNSIFDNSNEEKFFQFWMYYLNKNYKKSISFLKEIENNSKTESFFYTKSLYWLNKTSQYIASEKTINPYLLSLPLQSMNYPYPIFARPFLSSKKEIVSSMPLLENIFKDSLNACLTPADKVKIKLKCSSFIKRREIKKELNLISLLVHAHLNSFAILQIQSIDKNSLTREEEMKLAEYSYLAFDYIDAFKFSNRGEKFEVKNLNYDSLTFEKKSLYKLNYPLAYWNYVKKAADLLNLDPFWLLSVMRAESLYDPNAESSVGAVGLMQIMPYTGINILNYLTSGQQVNKKFSISMLRQPDKSIMFSAWYLKLLLENYKGNYILATAAYNAGPAAVNRWIKQYPNFDTVEFYENIPYNETKKYVSFILGSMDIYSRIYLNHNEHLDYDVNSKLTELNPDDLF